MGTIKQGILGGFSGRVGTVVGSNWKSVHYMRALATNISNPRTEKQQCQRTKFSKAISFLSTITPFLRVGYKSYATDQSAFNAAMSYTMKNAMTGCGDALALDYEKILVAHGNLTVAVDATVTIEGNKASYKWTDNSNSGNAKTKDAAMLLVYNKDKREAAYSMNAATRSDAKAELALPASWSSNAMAIYLSFCSEDGKSVTNSICLKNDRSNSDSGNTNPGGGSGDENDNPLG